MKKISVYSSEFPLEPSATRRDCNSSVISKQVSDEMHQFETHLLDPNASEEDLAAFLAPPPPKTFDEFIAETRQQVDAELAEAGWPPGNKYVRVLEDGWELASVHDLAAPFEGVSLSMGSFYIRERCAVFSRDWFLAKLSDALSTVESSTGDARAWAIFRFAGALGTLNHRVHYPKVRKAVKNTRDAAAGGHARAQAIKGRTADILTEMRRRINAGHSVERAAVLCAKVDIGTSPGANAKLWRRHN